ncbi:DNA ligase D [Burkholderia gladioli]|uniref:DNA ligase D n=1 Tax=Burkholderia gladioli TaxID=28095 RepID=UPI00039991F2|nr:DNA ligase D [Burkholderia gladioli]
MGKPLDEYDRKRRFDSTPEPAGARSARGRRGRGALQFVVQKHDARRLHYDFRLELNGTLKSWAIPKGPSLDPKVKRLAVHVEDHPVEYASFEGHIPEGHYGAGDVIVWDRGVWIPDGDPVEGYRKGRLNFTLDGEKLAGTWHLVRTRMEGKQEQWFLIKSGDDAARRSDEYDIVEALPDSVLSERGIPGKRAGKTAAKAASPHKGGRRTRASPLQSTTSLEGARQAPLPATFRPQLATLVDGAPDGEWRYEIKFDGYRMLTRIDGTEVRIFTRNGHDWTGKLHDQAEAMAGLKLASAWLDGEVVVLDQNGLPDFQALQNAFEEERSSQIHYYLFDIPYLNGMDLRGVPLEARRSALAAVLERNRSPLLHFSEDFNESPETLLNSACELKLEGLIGKRAGSLYQSRRSDDWIKLKCRHRQEFVIAGYTEPSGSRSAFGALVLGLHDADSGELRYAGKVGTGFNETTLRTIFGQLKPLETKRSPLANPPRGHEAKGAHWVRPELLAEVAYAQMTREGVVRHSVFHGLRTDKPAVDIEPERATPRRAVARRRDPAPAATGARGALDQVRITHPDRVIDAASGITKVALARYYAEISPRLLPHLRNRPVALVRAPDGIAGELFFQKNAAKLAIPDIASLGKEYAGQPVMMINSLQALLGAVQMGAVEFHTWNATQRNLDCPDRLILDLDPDPALPWKRMVEATQLTLVVLEELGLKAFLKTSGGKGIHVVVPLTPRVQWDDVKDFSQALVRHMAATIPERFTAVSGPRNRVGRIFIDYLRNNHGATTVAAFSTRAREGLPVSVPIHYHELVEIKGAGQWTVSNVLKRLTAGYEDPWKDYPKVRQSVTVALRRRLIHR